MIWNCSQADRAPDVQSINSWSRVDFRTGRLGLFVGEFGSTHSAMMVSLETAWRLRKLTGVAVVYFGGMR
jgi:hypothetical protein